MALLKILGRSAAVQRVVRSEGVVEAIPVQQWAAERCDVQGAVIQLVELLRMGALRPLDMAVELRGAWRQSERDQLEVFAAALTKRASGAARDDRMP